LKYLIFALISLATLSASIYQAVFITPYSTLPLLIFGFFKIINTIQNGNVSNSFLLKITIFQIVAVLTNPHIIPCVLILFAGLLIYLDRTKSNISLALFGFSSAILTTYLWEILQKIRATDLHNYQNLIDPNFNLVTIFYRLGSIFPQAIIGYQFDSSVQILMATWFSYLIFGILTFIILFDSDKKEVKFLLLSLVFLSSYSVFLDFYLKYSIPPRYGLSGFYLMSLMILKSKIKSNIIILFFAIISIISTYLFITNQLFSN
jgi:hypothetical protein